MGPLKAIFCTAAWMLIGPLMSWSGDIVFPWRAVPVIARTGERFTVLFNQTKPLTLDSVVLRGPFNRIRLGIEALISGHFEYDPFTKQWVNYKMLVRIPRHTPEELYDLSLFSKGEENISRRSVKVLRKYRSDHKFIHISDPHISRQWIGTSENGYAMELELFDRFVDVANIIAPDFILVTGDIIHHYTMFDADSTGWDGRKKYGSDEKPQAEEKFRNYFEGAKGFSGTADLRSPAFSLPGNHDFYGLSRDNYMDLARQWNENCGKRVYGFSYAGTRVLAADNFLGDPINDRPDSALLSGLQGRLLASFLREEGSGKIRILAQHRHDLCDTGFINRNKIQILLNGHDHRPYEQFIGSTPTLSSRPGAVCRSGELENWQETLGFFRIFYIRGGKYNSTQPLRICKNPTVTRDQLDMNLTLKYVNPNDGTCTRNEAVIRNSFPVDLPGCKVRFVMKKGKYRVSGGRICQVISTPDVSVVDVCTSVKSEAEIKIEIMEDSR